MEINVVIKDPIGLHARPASIICQEANKYKSDINLVSPEGKSANLKSIMSVMALGIKNGETVKISAKGADEEEAINSIKAAMQKSNLI